jgi:hypothetical protein
MITYFFFINKYPIEGKGNVIMSNSAAFLLFGIKYCFSYRSTCFHCMRLKGQCHELEI